LRNTYRLTNIGNERLMTHGRSSYIEWVKLRSAYYR